MKKLDLDDDDFQIECQNGVVFYKLRDLFSHYSYIKDLLDYKICVAKEKVQIIEKCKISNTFPTKEDLIILNKAIYFTANELSLVLQAKYESKSSKYQNFDPILISNMEALLLLTQDICNNYGSDTIIQKYVILMSTAHAFPLILTYGQQQYCIHSCDAGNISISNFTSIYKLVHPGHSTIDPTINIEAVFKCMNINTLTLTGGCGTFSVQNLSTMLRMADQKLLTLLGNITVNRDEMLETHPGLIKNTQSLQRLKNFKSPDFLEDYKFSAHYNNLDDYIAHHSIQIDSNCIQNRAIDYKQYEYLLLAMEVLQSAYSKGGNELVQQILQERTGAKILVSNKTILKDLDFTRYHNEIDQYVSTLKTESHGDSLNEEALLTGVTEQFFDCNS